MLVFRRWITTVWLAFISQPGLSQYPFPMYPAMPPPLPPPMPFPIPVPQPVYHLPPSYIQVKLERRNVTSTTTTTTTTTERCEEDIVIRFPARPPPLSQGPPMPYAMLPPPVIVVSYPSEYPVQVKKPRKPKKHRFSYRKSADVDSDELVNPVLSYVSTDGDVKFKTRITNNEAAMMLGDDNYNKRHYKTVRVSNMPVGDKTQIKVESLDNQQDVFRDLTRKMFLRTGVDEHVLNGGKKELIFSPTGDKKISNFSVSFHVSE